MDQTPDQPFVLGALNSRPNPGAPLGLFLALTMWLASVALSVSLLDSHFSFPNLSFLSPESPYCLCVFVCPRALFSCTVCGSQVCSLCSFH